MSSHKELATQAFKDKNLDKAIEEFTLAIQEAPTDNTLYNNRSACYYNKNEFMKALEDANKAIEINATNDKSFQRKAMALHKLYRYDEAIEAYEAGLKILPTNQVIIDNLEQCKKEKAASEAGGNDSMPGQDGGLSGMFGPAGMQKLMANPRTAGYFQDPQFR